MTFERILAFHCAPTLAGIKPANLIAHEHMYQFTDASKIEEIRNVLLDNHIRMEQLQICPKKELTLIYNENVLEAHLKSTEHYVYLDKLGYPMAGSIQDIIEHLRYRILVEGAFPHEVGLFLGYPLDDVHGFIVNNGQNCKFCGYWKVYGDEQSARCLFDAFTKVRDEMLTRIDMGDSLPQILSRVS